jgi:hypothetical protein
VPAGRATPPARRVDDLAQGDPGLVLIQSRPLHARGHAGQAWRTAISRLVRADAWWTIPIGQAKFVRGELFGVHPLPGTP